MISCNTTGDFDNLIHEKELKASNNTSSEIKKIDKQIVEVSSQIIINESLIEENQERFFNDLNNGILFNSDYITFSELGKVFEDYFEISQIQTEELFNIFYDNREIIYNEDPNGILLAKAIATEAESYNISKSAQNKVIFGVIVSIINPKGCGWGVAAGIADTAASAVLTAATSPTGVGAVVGAISTAGFYADTVVKAARCKK